MNRNAVAIAIALVGLYLVYRSAALLTLCWAILLGAKHLHTPLLPVMAGT
jgi:hypothetical protein